MSYDDFYQHVIMLKDSARTRAFEGAIREVVRPGMRVLDFGCGTGILSFFAERAGAEQVYAVDQSAMISAAEAIARRNDFRRITFLRTDGDAFSLPEKVDVIVSEWMGFFVLYEKMLPPLIAARDAHLTPQGVMIPSAIRWRAALIVDKGVYDDKAFFDEQPYGVDFSLVREWAFSDVKPAGMTASQLSESFPMTEMAMRTVASEPTTIEGRTRSDRDLEVYGLCGWFDAELSASVTLETGPTAVPTHWRQMIFPVPRPLSIRAGEEVSVRVRPIRFEGSATHWHWSIKTPSDSVSCDDFSYRAHIFAKKGDS